MISLSKISRMFVLPNRKAFSDSITRIFLKYRKTDLDPLSEDAGEDLCLQRGDAKNSRELFSYQKIVREYLLMETPYRGLLLYHGLGSGKTCSSIAVAESLLTTKKCYIMLPASLSENYRGEIRKCGDPIYAFEQYWESKNISSKEDREKLITEIAERTKMAENGLMPPINIFPEGATTNGESLIQFKRGAFASLMAVKPFYSKMWSLTGVSIAPTDCIPLYAYLHLIMACGIATFTLYEMPVFRPN
jgi:SNF2 family DNA or RNA helicase